MYVGALNTYAIYVLIDLVYIIYAYVTPEYVFSVLSYGSSIYNLCM